MNFLAATKRWCAHAEKCGNLPDDARAWLDRMAKMGV